MARAPGNPAVESGRVADLVAGACRAATALRSLDQETVDGIVRAMAIAGLKANTVLARMAVEETGIGVFEDKVLKNYVATEFLYDYLRDKRSVGIIDEDPSRNVRFIAEPIGVVLAVLPLTNPTSTALFKAIVAAKTRNAVILRPSSRASRCVAECVRILVEAGEAAGIPEGAIQCLEEPTLEETNELFFHPQVDLIWTTGGQKVVEAANATGKPTISVGPGNAPVYMHESADIPMAVVDILVSKTFDASVICPAEQTVVVDEAIWDDVMSEFMRMGAYLCNSEEATRLRSNCFNEDTGDIRLAAIGRTAGELAAISGIEAPSTTKVLIVPVAEVEASELLLHEKLFPVLAAVRVTGPEQGIAACEAVLDIDGLGHTSSIYARDDSVVDAFSLAVRTGRILVNAPTTFGAFGGIYTDLPPTLSLGCGTWGGSNTTDNVNYRNLLNVKQVTLRKAPPMWFRSPVDIYFNEHAVDNIRSQAADNVAIITSMGNVRRGAIETITRQLEGTRFQIYAEVGAEPDIDAIDRGVEFLRDAGPELVIAVGGGSVIDAAKVMRLRYENPDASIEDLTLPFLDVRKRISEWPERRSAMRLVAVPTTSGSGAEVSPAAVITDPASGRKLTLIDYSLVPEVAIVDPRLAASMPPELTADTGVDALTHALEALVSIFASPYTEALSAQAANLVLHHLPLAFRQPGDREARLAMHNAATIGGLAIANASVGVCHALAHAFGATFGISHGRSNGLFLPHVIAYNAEIPTSFMPAPGYTSYVAPEQYGRMARVIARGTGTHIFGDDGADEARAEHLRVAVNDLLDAVEIPRSIADCGIDRDAFEARLDSMVDAAMDDVSIRTNPRRPAAAEVRALFEAAWAGR